MDCAEEVALLKRALGLLVGGENRLTFDILNAELIVESGPESVATEAIIEAVAPTGMRAEVWQGTTDSEHDSQF
ncbi:MAG: hypothetical protein DWQ31_19655 [Planctomycetota bacterium]|nr:MAG: hypothetical protein DWQ31_19655 [Planctomycetota bacterium]REJ88756.1 MAG: hypothetical protein DWQ35_19325 [Planctomycetota bacterium]REK26597.1 MAG: hypothetical protein DWQ42_08720 [Planctomycetota bacterium]REK46098.1 MAG: hypothetical protein DWQ46_07245 [Planctomycetota bacterium]